MKAPSVEQDGQDYSHFGGKVNSPIGIFLLRVGAPCGDAQVWRKVSFLNLENLFVAPISVRTRQSGVGPKLSLGG
jgi:hypothetical protein